MKVEESTRRLAFIKYLYSMAVEQSMKPEPTCVSSVLTFHDSIELFLELASEHLNVGKSGIDFMEYWELLKQKLKGDGLTQKESIRQLNMARVGLKHSGIFPSKLAIEGFRASVTNFFEENTPTVFDVRFADISLIELIKCQATKDSLREAEKNLKDKKIEDSLDNVAIAFSQLVDDYESRKKDEFGRSPFFFGDGLSLLADSLVAGDLEGFVGRTNESLRVLQDAVKILSLGLDYRRYAIFRLLTPIVLRLIGGKYVIQRTQRGSRGNPTTEDVRFCVDFVIESAIILQEFDFEVEHGKHPTLSDVK